MKRIFMVCLFGAIFFFASSHAAFTDTITRFNFTQPNFSGEAGNSFLDVAILEQRGGGEYLRLQRKSLEAAVGDSSVESERKKVGLVNDKVVLERNKVNLESEKINLERLIESQNKETQPQSTNSTNSPNSNNNGSGSTGANASGTQKADSQNQTVYNVESWYQNTWDGSSIGQLYKSDSGEVYGSVNEKNDKKESSSVLIDNTGNVTYYQDEVTKKIETGEYNDINIASGTGGIQQNPISTTNVVTQSGN